MESELEMVERHIREGQVIVDRQSALIVSLQENGHDSGGAKELLAMFRSTLKQHYEHLDRLKI